MLHEVIWQKSQSRSGRDRGATALHALYLGVETVGLGVGLGSNRPSGLLFYILSNMGIPGLLLFSYLLSCHARADRSSANSPDKREIWLLDSGLWLGLCRRAAGGVDRRSGTHRSRALGVLGNPAGSLSVCLPHQSAVHRATTLWPMNRFSSSNWPFHRSYCWTSYPTPARMHKAG